MVRWARQTPRRAGPCRGCVAGSGAESVLMPHTPETKVSAGQPNIQDVFLNFARRERLSVAIQLMSGESLEGRIKNFDPFAVIVEVAGADHMLFKHAIASIKAPRAVANYFSHN